MSESSLSSLTPDDSWVDVPRVVDGTTTFTAADMNAIIDSLAYRTTFLYNRFNNLVGNQGYIYTDVGFTAACHKGTLVSQNPVTGEYEPASAEWSTATRSDGSWVPSYKAYVKGLLITEPSGNSATIMCSGWSNDSTLLAALGISANQGVGDYYLTTDGIATRGNEQTREMRVYCYSLLGSGKLLINPKLPEYAGHSHNHVLITTTWVAANQATGVTLSSTATYATNLGAPDAPANLKALIMANPNHTCLVKNGEEVMEGTWGIIDTWLYITFNLEANDVFSLHAITPLTANEPIVRSVQKTRNNSLLDITSTGGKVFIGVNNTPTETNAYTGTGVVSLDSTGIKTGPVVQALKAGPGISLSHYVDSSTQAIVPGVVTITATQFAGTMTDMMVCNLDRVVMGTSFNGISYVFPQGATSTLIGTIRIPHFDSSQQEGELVFVFQGSSSAIPALSVDVLIQPTPNVDDSTEIGVMQNHSTGQIGNTVTDRCYCKSISLGGATGQPLYSDGLLICKVKSQGSVAVTLLSVSLRLL